MRHALLYVIAVTVAAIAVVLLLGQPVDPVNEPAVFTPATAGPAVPVSLP